MVFERSVGRLCRRGGFYFGKAIVLGYVVLTTVPADEVFKVTNVAQCDILLAVVRICEHVAQ